MAKVPFAAMEWHPVEVSYISQLDPMLYKIGNNKERMMLSVHVLG